MIAQHPGTVLGELRKLRWRVVVVRVVHLLLVDLLLYAVAHDSVGGAAQRARKLLDTTADLTHPGILATDDC